MTASCSSCDAPLRSYRTPSTGLDELPKPAHHRSLPATPLQQPPPMSGVGAPPPGTALGRGPASPDEVMKAQRTIAQSISQAMEPSDRLIAQEAEAKLVRLALPLVLLPAPLRLSLSRPRH